MAQNSYLPLTTRFYFFPLVLIFTALPSLRLEAQTVTINPANRYQTIVGWGNSGGYAGKGYITSGRKLVPDSVYSQILDEAFLNLGFTSTYVWPNTYVNWEGKNDNDDYQVAGTFNPSAAVDWADLALQSKQRVESLGDQFLLIARGNYSDDSKWLVHSPGEYGELMLTYLAHLKSTYNLDVAYWGVENEPSNGNKLATPTVMANTMRFVGPKVQAAGFPTKFMYPEGISALESWNWIAPLQSDPTIWNYVGLITWHLYGNQDPYRDNMYQFASPRGIVTGQTEAAPQGVLQLYGDLTKGGASYWAEGFALTGRGGAGGAATSVNAALNGVRRSTNFYHVRQVLRYVRPGATRIDAASASSLVKALAFTKNGKITAIAINTDTAARNVSFAGLPAGSYGVAQTVGLTPYQELGVRLVSGNLTLSLPAGATVTVYPVSGVNQPPNPTDWQVTPEYLVAPNSTVSVTASATDPELDPISYTWSVVQKPTGSTPVFASPNAASSTVSGLSANGSYTFRVTIRAGTHNVTRDVFVNRYAQEQPPYLWEFSAYRLGKYFTGAPITVKSDAFSMDGSAVTYSWTILSKPPGSNVTILSPTKSSFKTSDVDLPGRYVFQLVATNQYGSKTDSFPVDVYQGSTSSPVIQSTSAVPNGAGRVQLSVTASDSDGEALSYWWSLESGPAGAVPNFVNPGARNTAVSGLASGNYVFHVAVLDSKNVVEQSVNVTVSAGDSTAPKPPTNFQ